MRYEVTWMTYEYNFDQEMDVQSFTSEQFTALDEAMKNYNQLRKNKEVYHVRIVVILEEFSR